MKQLLLIFLLALSLPLQAGKPGVPVELQLAAQQADGSIQVTVSLIAFTAFVDGKVTLQPPASVELLDGNEIWQGTLNAHDTQQFVLQYQVEESHSTPLLWRATFRGRFAGQWMSTMAMVKLDTGQTGKAAGSVLPVIPKYGVLEFPGR